MRLNRVLQLNRVPLLVAGISLMVFALVFTISCSGEDGKNGREGDSCLVKPNGDDWDLECGGKYVGTLLSGNGPQGPKGNPGTPGGPGKNCWLGPKSGEAYPIYCEGDDAVQGTLQGCSIKEVNKYELKLTCGTNVSNLCSGIRFSPGVQYCKAESNRGVVTDISLIQCGKSKLDSINPGIQYCGFAANDPDTLKTPTHPYTICTDEKDEEDGDTKGLPKGQPNQTEWNNEYCRYTGSRTATVAGGDVPEDFCNGARINEGEWKGEYCGYKTVDSKFKEVITGICDIGGGEGGKILGPNQEAFGQGYCVAVDPTKSSPKGNLKTTYTEDLCGFSGTPNNGVWKNEYCGYAEGAAEGSEPTQVYTGLCDDTQPTSEGLKGPHATKYNAGYCAVLDKDSLTNKTTFVSAEEGFCGGDPTKKPNDGKWLKQYCGFGPGSEEKDQLLDTRCDDNGKLNEEAYNADEYCEANRDGFTTLSKKTCANGDKINVGKWNGEYCGKTIDGDEVRFTGACDDGQGPNSEAFSGPGGDGIGYCQIMPAIDMNSEGDKVTNSTYKSVYSTLYCGGKKLNESTKGPGGTRPTAYCGMASKGDTLIVIGTGACDDGKGPNMGDNSANAASGYCRRYNEATQFTYYSDEWCVNPSADSKGVKKKTGKDVNFFGGYCSSVDGGVFQCTGGFVGIESAPGVPTTAAAVSQRCILPALVGKCTDEGGTYQYDEYAKSTDCVTEETSPTSASCDQAGTVWVTCNIFNGVTKDYSSSATDGEKTAALAACKAKNFGTGSNAVGFKPDTDDKDFTKCTSKAPIKYSDCTGSALKMGDVPAGPEGDGECRYKPSLALGKKK